jgi:large subunit ribosomal protein L18
MNKSQKKVENRNRRHARIRSRVIGSAAKPRLAVYRSNRYVYAQLINDADGTTLAAADSRKEKGNSMSEKAIAVGKSMAAQAAKAGIEKVVFDRGGFQYQGVIAALADGAREGGLKF